MCAAIASKSLLAAVNAVLLLLLRHGLVPWKQRGHQALALVRLISPLGLASERMRVWLRAHVCGISFEKDHLRSRGICMHFYPGLVIASSVAPGATQVSCAQGSIVVSISERICIMLACVVQPRTASDYGYWHLQVVHRQAGRKSDRQTETPHAYAHTHMHVHRKLLRLVTTWHLFGVPHCRGRSMCSPTHLVACEPSLTRLEPDSRRRPPPREVCSCMVIIIWVGHKRPPSVRRPLHASVRSAVLVRGEKQPTILTPDAKHHSIPPCRKKRHLVTASASFCPTADEN